MDVKEFSCATGNLVDISFTDPMYGTKQQVETIDVSPLRENKVSLIDMDDKQFFTPQCIVKTLSPRSMSSISQEASRIISKLHDSEVDLESTLLADELFPMRLSFDNVSFEEAPSKDMKITPFQYEAEASPELQIQPILNLSKKNNIEATPLAEEVNQIPEEFRMKTIPGSNLPTDGKDELLVEKSVEFNKPQCIKTNFSSFQKRSCVERQVHELQKSNKTCLPETISKKTLSTPKASKLVKPMSHVSKNDNDEKENVFVNGNEKHCNLKKPHSNSSRTPQVNKVFNYEQFQKSNIKPLINDAIYSGTEVRQVLSPIKNTTIDRNYLLKRTIIKANLNPSESLTTSKLVFAEQGSNASHTSKPRELGFQKPTCKSALRVPPPGSVHALQRSNSFQVTRLRELHMKQEQPLLQKGVQRSTSACSSMNKNKVKTHLIPPAVVHSMKGTPAKLTAYQSGKKLLTPQYNRRPIDLSASFHATPFGTPQSTRILPPVSGSSNLMIAPPSTPLSSKDKLSRRFSFVPTQLSSAGKKKSG